MATKKKTKKTATKNAKKTATKKTATKKKAQAPRGKSDGPVLFRINVEVGDVARAATEWGAVLGMEGRLQAGSRVYFSAGPVTLQVVQVAPVHPAAKALYFLVDELEPVHARAQQLGWLSTESVHGEEGGVISVRPWGERSFYAQDPWGNPLCFVQSGTTYPG